MLWTDYFRIKEQYLLVENSAFRVRRLLRAGAIGAAMTEVACLHFNYKALEKMKEDFKSFIFDTRLEKEVCRLIAETHSLMEKHRGKQENDKTRKNI